MQDLQAKKEKDLTIAEEEKKKKDRMKQLAREQAKQNFDKITNQPGLKEMQDKGDEKSDEDEGDETEEKVKPKKKKAA